MKDGKSGNIIYIDSRASLILDYLFAVKNTKNSKFYFYRILYGKQKEIIYFNDNGEITHYGIFDNVEDALKPLINIDFFLDDDPHNYGAKIKKI